MPITIKRASEPEAKARPARLLAGEEAACRILRLEDIMAGIEVSVVEIEVSEETIGRFDLDEDAHVVFIKKEGAAA